jgi:hypothetical protein
LGRWIIHRLLTVHRVLSPGILRLTTDFEGESPEYFWISATFELARSGVTGDRYVVIRVAYDCHPSYGRSLEWIAPELGHAGLIMTEDRTDEPSPSRTWTGILDGATFEHLADSWRLDAQLPESASGSVPGAGKSAMQAYTFDGMNWESGGESPIVYVSLLVGVVRDPRYTSEGDDARRVRVHG